MDVLKLIATGLNGTEVGDALYISEGTVKSHLRHLCFRTGCSTRLELVIYGLKAGWLNLDEIKLIKKVPQYDQHGNQFNVLDECQLEPVSSC
jgi:DNA-binding CsgD family transcriptional regulator